METNFRFLNVPSDEAMTNAFKVIANSIARQVGRPIELTLKNKETNEEVVVASRESNFDTQNSKSA